VVVDCTDSFSSRYLINDACLLLNKTFVYGAIFQFEGQAAVFNYPLKQGRSCHYRDLFPNPPQAGEVPSCNEAGVLGTLTAIIGNLQANEVIKIITGIGIPLVNRLFVYNSHTGRSFELALSHSADAARLLPVSVSAMEATDYNFYCAETRVEEIDGEKFTLLIQQTRNPVVIVDVRNENEIPQLKHPGVLKLPLAEFTKHEMNIPPGETLVLICQSGVRSRKAAQLITNKSRFKYIFNLQGGVNELEIKGII
jgi:adenylyltransferase/sulfurtransferase